MSHPMRANGRLLYKPFEHTYFERAEQLPHQCASALFAHLTSSKHQTHPGVRPDGHWNLSGSEEHVALLFFFVNHLIILIDDGYGEEDTSTTANGTEEVGNNR